MTEVYCCEAEWMRVDEALRQVVGKEFAEVKSGSLVKANDVRSLAEAVSSTMRLREVRILNTMVAGAASMKPEGSFALVQVFEWTGSFWRLGQLTGTGDPAGLRRGGIPGDDRGSGPATRRWRV